MKFTDFKTKNKAIGNKTVPVFELESIGKEKFQEKHFEIIALILEIKERNAHKILRYFSDNINPDKCVVCTTKALAEKTELGLSVTSRVVLQLKDYGLIYNIQNGVLQLTPEFATLLKKPRTQTDFVIKHIEIRDEVDLFEDEE